MCDAVRWAGALLTVSAPCPPSYQLSRRTCARLRPAGETGEPASLPRAEVSPALTLQVHLVQLSTTQVSFSAKKRPSCQQADMFLVLGGPPMSSQRTWLSLDWKIEGNVYVWAEATSSSRSQTGEEAPPSGKGAPGPCSTDCRAAGSAGGELGPREASPRGVTSQRSQRAADRLSPSRGAPLTWPRPTASARPPLNPYLFLLHTVGAQREAVGAGGGTV